MPKNDGYGIFARLLLFVAVAIQDAVEELIAYNSCNGINYKVTNHQKQLKFPACSAAIAGAGARST
jgi:hypothetical protein